VHGLCKALVALGFEVDVCTTNVDGDGITLIPLGQRVNMDGVGVLYFPVQWPRRLYRSPAMRRFLQNNIDYYDIIHIHTMFLWPGLMVSRLASKKRIPYVVSPRGMLVDELIQGKSRQLKQLWIRLFDRKMIERAAGIHVTSEQERDDLRSFGFELPDQLLIPNGITLPTKLMIDKPSDLKSEYVLYLGRIDPKKGLDVLIAAMVEVPAKILVIAGSGEERYMSQLHAQVNQLGLAERVQFVGHANDREKWAYYRNAALFVLPSVNENFGNTVLEAMASGCPVVVSPGVGLADTVTKHDCGRVVTQSAAEIAQAIRELLDDPTTAREMGKRGEQVAESHYSWSRIAADMSSAYQQLTKRNVEEAKLE